MMYTRFCLLTLAILALAGCASDTPPERRRQTFGPGAVMPGMSTTTDMGTFQGAAGWHAGTPSYRPQALPPGFKSE